MKKNKQKIASRKKQEIPAPTFSVIRFHTILIPIGLILLIISLHLNVFSNLESIINTKNKEEFIQLFANRNMKLCFLLLFSFILLYYTIKYNQSRLASYICSFLIWIFIFFYGFEFYLSAYPPSQGNGEAYVSKIWFKKYWQINNYGFRDKEYIVSELIPKNNLLLYLGDSFVAGHGIKDPKDRTPDLLEKLLKHKYDFINAGVNGIGTNKEYNILRTFPARPKVVILSHVSNDIEEILPTDETYYNTSEKSSLSIAEFLYAHSRNSVFLDLCYHFIEILGIANLSTEVNETEKSEINSIYDWYKIDSLFNKHLNALQLIADYTCDSLNAKLIIITYPENYEIDSCDLYINKKIINNLKQKENMFFLNVSSIFKERKESKRRVNFFDGHPSKLMNRIVADSLKVLMESEAFKKDD